MTNEEIDRQIQICMGWSGHPNEQPVRKDIEQIGPGILLLLAEIAKRLGGSTVPVWIGPDGKPEPIGAREIRYALFNDSGGNPKIGMGDLMNILGMLGCRMESSRDHDTTSIVIKGRF